MAHTLKAYYYTDPATAVTVDFMSAIADNDGIATTSYQMGIPGIEQARNNSLYSDTPRPTWSKHGTVTDVLTVDVKGSTNTNLYTNLHLLAKLGEYARMGAENRRDNPSAYLELKPGGSAAGEVLYAAVYDCRVELPADWANTQDARLTIEDVTVTVERGLWRALSPDGTNGTANIQVNTQAFASSASSSADIAGDTTAVCEIRVQHNIGSTTGQIDRCIIGYRSKMNGGDKYDACGKLESESATLGTDTSAVADATASGGNVARCTFGTPADTLRLYGAKIPRGVHRIFARMKITGTAVASVTAKYCDETVANGGSPIANTAVSVTSTSWLVFDLGIFRALQTSALSTGELGTYQIWAALTSGAGNLDIDWVYVMPTEGYITAQGLGIGTSSPSAALVFTVSNITERLYTAIVFTTGGKVAINPSYTSSLAPPPGPFALYWLIGTDSGSTYDVGIHASLTLTFTSVARYLMPSEI